MSFLQNLRLANDEMARLREKDFKDLLCHRRKLYLVLDLDHTLLNSARLSDIKDEEETYLNNQRDSLPGNFSIEFSLSLFAYPGFFRYAVLGLIMLLIYLSIYMFFVIS